MHRTIVRTISTPRRRPGESAAAFAARLWKVAQHLAQLAEAQQLATTATPEPTR
jgi:hypothetical protein